jgi:hypothetical protein
MVLEALGYHFYIPGTILKLQANNPLHSRSKQSILELGEAEGGTLLGRAL